MDVHARPAERVAELVGHLGAAEVVAWCAGLLAGDTAYDDPAFPSLAWLGGPHALVLLEQGDLARTGNAYWPRVWAVRALGLVGEGEHASAVRAAEDDPESSVRRAAAVALVTMRLRLDRDV